MPAKSFIDVAGGVARAFYATVIRGEVSDANVRGYLRAATQIEDVWQQIDARIIALGNEGKPVWEAYGAVRYPLAHIRAARTYQVCVQELLAADTAADPGTAGYLPPVTYDQANAFCHAIQPHLQQAVAALADGTYIAPTPAPFTFGPRIEVEGHVCPTPHLQGMLAAARECRQWATGLLAEYQQGITHAQQAVPAEIMTHLTTLQRHIAEADSQMQFGTDLVGQITQGEATTELHEEAEGYLWKALEAYFLLNQVIAAPLWLGHIPPQINKAPSRTYHDIAIVPDDLWRVAAPSAQGELRGTEFGSDEMEEMCEKMGNILSAGAQQYLDESEAALRNGDIMVIAAMANCPFEPLYRSRNALDIAGAHIAKASEFHWDFHRGHIDVQARFQRVAGWQECEE